MYNLHHRLWIAISCSTLVLVAPLSMSIAASYPVPKPPSKVVSQLVNKAPTTDDISPPPVEAVLASVKLKSSAISKTGRNLSRQGANSRSISKVPRPSLANKTGRHISADRSLQGISNLTNIDRVNNVSAVNRLIE
jgi:hypothetical protein